MGLLSVVSGQLRLATSNGVLTADHGQTASRLPIDLTGPNIPFMRSPGSISLSECLSPATIQLNLAATDAETVLAELVDCVPAIRDRPEDRQTLLRALHEREQLHSTGIGDGVALPHARNALIGLVDRPVIVFGRSAQGIPYSAIDGAPARLFFLIVAPTVTQHLAVLARVSRMLRDPKVRQDLLKSESASEALAVIRAAEENL